MLHSIRRAYARLEHMGLTTFRWMDAAYSRAWRGARPESARAAWPVTPGAYVIGDPQAPVAVCTLTNAALARPIALLPGVSIAGRLYTSNLGIEKIVRNVASNPAIRALVVCGKESPLFKPAQSLAALVERGVDGERRIAGAEGYQPVLSGVDIDTIEQFRRQVTFVNRAGEADLQRIQSEVARLARELGWEAASARPNLPRRGDAVAPDDSGFMVLRPGGQREPLAYDPKGYFVISIDRGARLIAAHHYLPDATPSHVIRGRWAEGIALALIREGLVSQLTHAAYLGAEFCKAETALRLDLDYEQDRPLQPLTPGSG